MSNLEELSLQQLHFRWLNVQQKVVCEEDISIHLVRQRLTISTPIYFQSEPDPSSGVPVQRDESEISRHHRPFKFVLDHSVCIAVTWKSLKQQNPHVSVASYLYFVFTVVFFWLFS